MKKHHGFATHIPAAAVLLLALTSACEAESDPILYGYWRGTAAACQDETSGMTYDDELIFLRLHGVSESDYDEAFGNYYRFLPFSLATDLPILPDSVSLDSADNPFMYILTQMNMKENSFTATSKGELISLDMTLDGEDKLSGTIDISGESFLIGAPINVVACPLQMERVERFDKARFGE